MVNLAVAFHCEGGETFDNVNRVPLSMSTLDNDRFLFISQERNEWVPTYLDLSEYSLYEITYELPSKVKVFDSFHEYHDLFYFNESTNKHMATPILQKYIAEGYRLFVLGENDKDELKESFLINPKDYVRAITLVSF